MTKIATAYFKKKTDTAYEVTRAERKTSMTNTQWKKVVERLWKYKSVRLPNGDLLILWENGDVSLRDGTDGHCIICVENIETIRRICVD